MKSIYFMNSIKLIIILLLFGLITGSFYLSIPLTSEQCKNIVLDYCIKNNLGNEIELIEKLYDFNNKENGYIYKINTFPKSTYITINSKLLNSPITDITTSKSSPILEKFLETNYKFKNILKDNFENEKSKIYFINSKEYVAKFETKDGIKYYYSLNDDVAITYEDFYNFSNPSFIFDNSIELSDGKNTSTENLIGENPIDNPDLLEKNYITKIESNVPNYNLQYFTSDYFDEINGNKYENHCSPLVATNLIYYWNNIFSEKIDILQNNSIENTFEKFFKLMDTSIIDGTSRKDISPSYIKYFEQKKISIISKHYTTYKDSEVIKQIDNGFPVHISLNNHFNYGNHSVLAVGYIRYQYKTTLGYKYKTYLRIVDGFVSTPNRFITSSSSGDWDYFTMDLKI